MQQQPRKRKEKQLFKLPWHSVFFPELDRTSFKDESLGEERIGETYRKSDLNTPCAYTT